MSATTGLPPGSIERRDGSRTLRGFAVQGRVIYALFLRELQSRFGRHQLGFLWLFIEPLLLASVIAGVRIMRQGDSGHYSGLDIYTFYLIGYIPYFAFRAVLGRAVGAFSGNASLLYHQRVKLIDVVLARNILEAMATLTVIALIVVGVAMITDRMPDSMPTLIGGIVLMLLYAQGLGLCAAAVSSVSDLAERFVHPLVYLSLPFSGAFFTMHSLPPSIREIFLWNPQVHFHEMVREGMFGDVLVSYFDLSFALAAVLFVHLIGLAAMRVVRPEF